MTVAILAESVFLGETWLISQWSFSAGSLGRWVQGGVLLCAVASSVDVGAAALAGRLGDELDRGRPPNTSSLAQCLVRLGAERLFGSAVTGALLGALFGYSVSAWHMSGWVPVGGFVGVFGRAFFEERKTLLEDGTPRRALADLLVALPFATLVALSDKDRDPLEILLAFARLASGTGIPPALLLLIVGTTLVGVTWFYASRHVSSHIAAETAQR